MNGGMLAKQNSLWGVSFRKTDSWYHYFFVLSNGGTCTRVACVVASRKIIRRLQSAHNFKRQPCSGQLFSIALRFTRIKTPSCTVCTTSILLRIVSLWWPKKTWILNILWNAHVLKSHMFWCCKSRKFCDFKSSKSSIQISRVHIWLTSLLAKNMYISEESVSFQGISLLCTGIVT